MSNESKIAIIVLCSLLFGIIWHTIYSTASQIAEFRRGKKWWKP